jgi:hypothetical protein
MDAFSKSDVRGYREVLVRRTERACSRGEVDDACTTGL